MTVVATVTIILCLYYYIIYSKESILWYDLQQGTSNYTEDVNKNSDKNKIVVVYITYKNMANPSLHVYHVH